MDQSDGNFKKKDSSFSKILFLFVVCVVLNDLEHYADGEETNIELPSRGSGFESSADGLHGPETNDRVNNDGVSVDLACDISTSRPSVQKLQPKSEAVDFTTSLNEKDNLYETKPISRKKSHNRTEKVESSRKHSKGKSVLFTDAKPQSSRRSAEDTVQVSASNHLLSVKHEGEKIALGHGKTTSEPSSSAPSAALSFSTIPLPSKAISKPKVSQASSSSSVLKTSMQKVVQHFRPPKSSKLSQPSTSVNEVRFTRKYYLSTAIFSILMLLIFFVFVCADELLL